MNFSSIFGKIKAAISPQSAQEQEKPVIPVIQAQPEEFQVIAQPDPIKEVQTVSAPEKKPKIAAKKTKPEKPLKPKGKPGRPRKIQPETVKEKPAPEPEKQLPVKSPAIPLQIDKPHEINEEQPKEISTIQELVESANGAITQNGANSQETAITRDSDKPWLWKPGESGNPSGRPKSAHFREAYQRIAERDGIDVYAQVVANDALTARKPMERLAAIQEMGDRLDGKAVQTTNVRGIIAMMPAESVLGAAFGAPEPDA